MPPGIPSFLRWVVGDRAITGSAASAAPIAAAIAARAHRRRDRRVRPAEPPLVVAEDRLGEVDQKGALGDAAIPHRGALRHRPEIVVLAAMSTARTE